MQTSLTPRAPRLAPIDRPRGLLQRLLRWYFRIRFGKVMMALRVLYPRIPGFTFAQLAMVRYAQKGLSLEPRLKHLIELRISNRNRCGFCGDLSAASLLDEGYPASILEEAELPLEDPRLDPKTRAALAYADGVTAHGTVDDATFDALRPHFDERGIAEIVWLTAFTNYHNLMARPLGLVSDGFCELVQRRRAASPTDGAATP